MKPFLGPVVLAAVGSLTATASFANLLANPAFDVNLAPWTISYGGWNGNDEAASPHSGAAVVNASPAAHTLSSVRQCVAVTPNGHYRFRGSVSLVPQPNSPEAAVAYARYASSDCTGSPLGGGEPGIIVGQILPRYGWRYLHNDNVVFPGDTHSIMLHLGIYRPVATADLGQVLWDNIVLDPDLVTSGPCTPGGPSDNIACLGGFRFRTFMTWTTKQGQSGVGRVVQDTPDSATFWFFDPSNTEVLVKVLDGCAVNQRYWVFISGLTNVQVNISVRDLVKQTVKTYSNAQGHAFTPILDTNAFQSCT
jgi:hypothetical protein